MSKLGSLVRAAATSNVFDPLIDRLAASEMTRTRVHIIGESTADAAKDSHLGSNMFNHIITNDPNLSSFRDINITSFVSELMLLEGRRDEVWTLFLDGTDYTRQILDEFLASDSPDDEAQKALRESFRWRGVLLGGLVEAELHAGGTCGDTALKTILAAHKVFIQKPGPRFWSLYPAITAVQKYLRTRQTSATDPVLYYKFAKMAIESDRYFNVDFARRIYYSLYIALHPTDPDPMPLYDELKILKLTHRFKARQLFREIFHPWLVRDLRDVGLQLMAQGRYGEAEVVLETLDASRSLTVQQRRQLWNGLVARKGRLGDIHPSLRTQMSSYAPLVRYHETTTHDGPGFGEDDKR